MGMFDRVYVPCPKCGELAEFQSKGGDCMLHDYVMSDDIPIEVLIDIKDDVEYCEKCGTKFGIEYKYKLSVGSREVVDEYED